jgi:hypothetical protein
VVPFALLTWANDKRYYTTHGITTFGMSRTNEVCEDAPKAAMDLWIFVKCVSVDSTAEPGRY